MTLEPNRMLSHYRLVEPIGEGGMGVVWRAFDSTLGRDVALKLLPDLAAASPQQASRFEREARLLAALNHPNIATVHGFETVEGISFLVLELVSGESLDERLASGPLPVSEALEVARQVALGMEAAHEKGIIHRDLKPANIRITSDGVTKVLDFGLAKAIKPTSDRDLSRSPTITAEGTRVGIILGTAPYMSPEQTRGRPLDRRTDIWSFGCVLYECLTGKLAFQGNNVADTIAAIVSQEPDWSVLPESLPAGVGRLLRRCLTKDDRQRLRDIGDARILLSEHLSGTAQTIVDLPHVSTPGPPLGQVVSPGRSRLLTSFSILILGVVLGVLGFWALQSKPPVKSKRAIHAQLPLLGEASLSFGAQSAVALSPDGSMLVYRGKDDRGRSFLYLRNLDKNTIQQLPETENASGPFFSPDGRWVGYFAEREERLNKVAVDGGAPVEICRAPAASRGAAWSRDDRIAFSPSYNQGLYVVAASGGDPVQLTRLREGEKSHRLPVFLPDNKTLLFVIGGPHTDSFDDAQIASLSLETGEIRPVLKGGSQPRWSSTGHLIYARGGSLFAASYEPQSGVLGPSNKILSGVATDPNNGPAHYDLSEEGTLVYFSGEVEGSRAHLVWSDRQGRTRSMGLREDSYLRVRLSPDGTQLALHIEAANADIWTYDLERQVLSRLTSGWDNEFPVWSHDGSRIIYSRWEQGENSLSWIRSDGSGEPTLLFSDAHRKFPSSVSPDGQYLLFSEFNPQTNMDIWLLPLARPEDARPLLATSFAEAEPAVSPDGRWLAYLSDESGRPEIYVTSFPDGGRRWTISNGEGWHPLWSRDGSELFFEQQGQMMAVAIGAGESFSPGKPRRLFELENKVDPEAPIQTSDLGPDGGFLFFQKATTEPNDLNIVLNFPALLEKD
ncbi:MAG: serine/threonine-protein kinase [Acidobacteria bacterium]|nr:MAG: serine/threonine-protein kinase [Acidobacteriota bacterium]